MIYLIKAGKYHNRENILTLEIHVNIPAGKYLQIMRILWAEMEKFYKVNSIFLKII